MPKILHVSRDNKFLDFAINCFEQVNATENYYLVISDEETITDIVYENIHRFSKKDAVRNVKATGFLKQFKAVIFHGISAVEQRVLETVDTNIKVIWFGYGYDYYPLLDFFMLSYLDKKTKKIWYRDKSFILTVGLKVNEVLPFWTLFKSRNQLKIFNRVDYFAPVLEQEYKMIKRMHPHFQAKYIDWNYELGGKIFKSIGEKFVSGTNFLIGNSASITNNHLDVFDLLTPDKLGENKVITPLSYGFPKFYKEDVKKAGLEIFKSKFVVMEEFIPFEEYLSTLRSCGFALFGSIRQQALGNIYMGLALGIKVYLNKKNPVFQELKYQGFAIYDFDDFKNETDFSKPLGMEFQKHNRELMRKMSLKENYLVKSKNLIDLVNTF